MAPYRAQIPPDVGERIRHLPPGLKQAVKAALTAISADPMAGDALHDDLAGFRKYRVRRFRIVYQVDASGRVLRILGVADRRTIYEELTERLKEQRK